VTVLVVTLTLVVAVLALLVAGLLRSHADILRRLHELDAGPAVAAEERARPVELRARADLPQPSGERPDFPAAADLAGRGLADDAVSITVRGPRHRTLLAFLSASCTTCGAFWRAFADPALALPPDVRLVVVTHDPEYESATALRALAPAQVPLVMSSRAWADYAVPGSPYFVLVDGAAGKVRGEGTGASWEQVRRLLSEATGDADLAARAAGRTLDLTTDDASREARIDRELLDAGIHPGHPSLYTAPPSPPGLGTGTGSPPAPVPQPPAG
jgi:cell wall assembly regulator SMI1